MKRSLFFALSLALATQARAADPRYPDWPCEQAKVPEISLAAIWSGPPLEDEAKKWKDAPGIPELAARIAARRTPLDEAQKLAEEAVTGSPEERSAKGKLLFAAVFELLNQQRSSVMDGLERVTRRLRQSAQKIRSDAISLQSLATEPGAEGDRVQQLTDQLTWETRIYDERRRMVRYVCEVPVAIDQRLFAIARTIQERMEE